VLFGDFIDKPIERGGIRPEPLFLCSFVTHINYWMYLILTPESCKKIALVRKYAIISCQFR